MLIEESLLMMGSKFNRLRFRYVITIWFSDYVSARRQLCVALCYGIIALRGLTFVLSMVIDLNLIH